MLLILQSAAPAASHVCLAVNHMQQLWCGFFAAPAASHVCLAVDPHSTAWYAMYPEGLCAAALQVFLYVSSKGRVVGLAVAEPLKHAFRVLAPAGETLLHASQDPL